MIKFKNAPIIIKTREGLIVDWLKNCVKEYGFYIGRVEYQFLNDKEIAEANKRFLDHDYATDIITFNYSESKRLEIEMLLGFETIEAQAGAYEEETLTEYCRVLVHGLLHCCGFNDRTKEESEVMRRQEEFCLNLRPKKLRIS